MQTVKTVPQIKEVFQIFGTTRIEFNEIKIHLKEFDNIKDAAFFIDGVSFTEYIVLGRPVYVLNELLNPFTFKEIRLISPRLEIVKAYVLA